MCFVCVSGAAREKSNSRWGAVGRVPVPRGGSEHRERLRPVARTIQRHPVRGGSEGVSETNENRGIAMFMYCLRIRINTHTHTDNFQFQRIHNITFVWFSVLLLSWQRFTLLPHSFFILCPLSFLYQDAALLNGRVTLHHAKAGTVLARQGDQVRRILHILPSFSPSFILLSCIS